jgi:hypothetical protein
LKVNFQLLVAPVFCIDGGNVSHVSDFTVVVLLELVLVGFDFLPQLPPLFLDVCNDALDLLLGQILTASFRQRFLQLLVVDVERSQRFLLIVIRLPFEVETEIAVVAFELIFNFFLLVSHHIDTHTLNVLLELYFSTAFQQ